MVGLRPGRWSHEKKGNAKNVKSGQNNYRVRQETCRYRDAALKSMGCIDISASETRYTVFFRGRVLPGALDSILSDAACF
jgi:hypothetical protein